MADTLVVDYDLQVVYGGSGGQYPEYEGDYEVFSRVDPQTLPTKYRSMMDDLTIDGIDVQRVSNPSGGITCVIGAN